MEIIELRKGELFDKIAILKICYSQIDQVSAQVNCKGQKYFMYKWMEISCEKAFVWSYKKILSITLQRAIDLLKKS